MMTRKVIVAPPELPLDRAWQLMRREQFRHLPVVSGGALVGIVSGGWFWFEKGVKAQGGSSIQVTWPARACNVGAIQRLFKTDQPLEIIVAAR